MTDIKFIDGLRVYRNEKAPKFVKLNMSVKVDALVKFLTQNQNEQGWVNIDVKESKKSVLYASLNEFKPSSKTLPKGQGLGNPEPKEEDLDTSLPF
jgi:hypothetical protein